MPTWGAIVVRHTLRLPLKPTRLASATETLPDVTDGSCLPRLLLPSLQLSPVDQSTSMLTPPVSLAALRVLQTLWVERSRGAERMR